MILIFDLWACMSGGEGFVTGVCGLLPAHAKKQKSRPFEAASVVISMGLEPMTP